MTATRWLDAIGASSNRAPVRTIVAQDLLARPDLDALYCKLGGGIVGRWRLSTFPPPGPLAFPYAGVQRMGGARPETLLTPEAMFNVDLAAHWSIGNADAFGETILNGFDVDDQGNVLIAATVFGWGILDPAMRPIFHSATESPGKIIALKSASGKYYAAINGARGGSIYDVTNRARPVKLNAPVPNILQFAKSASDTRVAIIDDRFTALRIWTAEGLASGAAPLFNRGGYTNVTSDGTNFFALKGNSIDVLVPSGNTYTAASIFFNDGLSQTNRIHYGNGYLVESGGDALNVWAWRVFKVSPDFDLTLVPIDLSATLAAEGMNASDGLVLERGGILELVLSGGKVGDVYQLGAVTPPVVTPPAPQPPTITDLGPISGPASGGQHVTITGEHLSSAVVMVADTLPAQIITNTDTQIVFAMPVGQVGGANIRVTTAGGTAVRWNGYTYTAAAPPDVDQGRVVDVKAREFASVEKADAWLRANPNAVSFPRWTASNGRTAIFTYT